MLIGGDDMMIMNTLFLLVIALFSYGLLSAGLEWYYVLMGAVLTYGILSSIMQMSSDLCDKLKK